MTSRERFRAWIETTDYLETLQPAAWAAWQARDAEVERLVEALRRATKWIDWDGRHATDVNNCEVCKIVNEFDTLLREYDKEKRDE